jgi:hypothetical protein
MPHGPKSDLSPADLKLAADAFEAALARLDEEPVDVSLHLLRRRLASHVMALVFSGENDLEVVVEQALTRLHGTEQQRGEDLTAPGSFCSE